MSAARPSEGARLPLGGRSVDMSPCLRTGECLATRPRLHARPWDARSAKGAT
jgi:hypothetical protein